jgi:hypothetical protein
MEKLGLQHLTGGKLGLGRKGVRRSRAVKSGHHHVVSDGNCGQIPKRGGDLSDILEVSLERKKKSA